MRRLLVLLAAVPAVLATAGAQPQYGKIAGTVVDAQTRELLAGANVVVEGTRLGGVTDRDGRYAILNVPPGTHNVSASLLGYRRVTKTGAGVFIDRTTTLDFRLSSEEVELQEVTVVAEKPKIIRDQTSSALTLDDAQIRSTPVEGLRGVLDLSASFQKNAQGNYSVRGSESYEVNFQINGVTQMSASTTAPGAFATDKANNSWKYDVNPLAVQQVQLISGGFTAEYGDAQAAVVKVVTKEGGPALRGELRTEVRPPGQYHFGDYVYSTSNREWQRWGTIEGWNQNRDRVIVDLRLDQRYPTLYQGYLAGDSSLSAQWNSVVDREIEWAHSVWLANHTPADDNPLGVYDYRQGWYTRFLMGIGGPLGKDPDLLNFYFSGEYRKAPTRLPTPERDLVYQNYLLNVIWQPSGRHKFRGMGMVQMYRGGIWSGSEDIRWSGLAFTPPGVSTKYYVLVDPVRRERTLTQSLNWLFAVDEHSFLEATLAHQSERYELPYETLPGTGLEADRLDSLFDPRGVVLKDGLWWETDYLRGPFNFSTNYYQDNRTDHWSLTADYTNQIDKSHLVKTGVRLLSWAMVNNGVNSSFQANTYVVRSGFAEYYRAFPYTVSAYVQDKMEFAGMVAQIGLRAEAYNFRVGAPTDVFAPFYQGTQGPGQLGDPTTEESETQFTLLPRVGVSFPIGENTAFRLQYGHFSSMPVFSQGLSQRTQSGWTGRGNPNLEPKKTVSYEMGLQQVLGADHRIDFAFYYNDRVRQVGTQRIAALTGSRERPNGYTSDNIPLYSYTTFANNAFGSTVGLEVKFDRIAIGRWSYRISYNLSQTTTGNYGPQDVYPDNAPAFEARNFTGEFLSSNDRTHAFRGVLQYALAGGEGPDLFGARVFENTVLSMTYTAQSGTPFTYRGTFDLKDAVNNRRYPLEQAVDLNATKSIDMNGLRLLLGLRVMNLFDNRWLTPMDVDDDINRWVQEGLTVADAGNAPNRLSYVVAQYRAYRNIPRQFYFTLGVSF
jgi:hypothetical protein